MQYLAARDVRRGYVTGRCELKNGIKPFTRLVEQVMSREPYSSAERIFRIADNGSSHRGEEAKLASDGLSMTPRFPNMTRNASL